MNDLIQRAGTCFADVEVVIREGRAATVDAFREHLSSRFADWQLPGHVDIRKAIPCTSTGKFLKRALRDEHANGVPGGQGTGS